MRQCCYSPCRASRGVKGTHSLPFSQPSCRSHSHWACPWGQRQREIRWTHRAVIFSLMLGVVGHIAALEAAAAYDLSALMGRYLRVIIVPIALLAGANLSRLRGTDLVLPIAVFVLPTAMLLVFTRHVSGNFTQAGFQDWRSAVDAMSQAEAKASGAPVLFRSGFAEDDAVTSGPLPPSQFAPLRSPLDHRFAYLRMASPRESSVLRATGCTTHPECRHIFRTLRRPENRTHRRTRSRSSCGYESAGPASSSRRRSQTYAAWSSCASTGCGAPKHERSRLVGPFSRY